MRIFGGKGPGEYMIEVVVVKRLGSKKKGWLLFGSKREGKIGDRQLDEELMGGVISAGARDCILLPSSL